MNATIQNWFVRMSSLCVIAFCCSTLLAEDDDDGPTLTIGSQAPSLDIEHWISDGNGRFKPVTKFEPGRVYVVEFWTNWCIAYMPKGVELKNKFADKNVQFIGVRCDDLPIVKQFLQNRINNDQEKPTYAEITGVYCVTTDPDLSVYKDYIEAAGSLGITSTFIVGKSGLIEWIGNPLALEEPLQKIIDEQWDRDAYLTEFKSVQEDTYLQLILFNLGGSPNIDKALAIVAKKKRVTKDDAAAMESLDELELNIHLKAAALMMKAGDTVDDVLARLDALAIESTPEQRSQIELRRIVLLLQSAISNAKYVEPTVAALTAFAEKEVVDPQKLNMFAWLIYKQSQAKDEYPDQFISVATTVAERGVKVAPDDTSMISTLAHLVFIQGDVDRAIKLQSEAVEKANDNNKESLEQFLEELKEDQAQLKD